MTEQNPDAPKDGETDDKSVDLQAEIDKWKAMARKHEERATANASAADELAKLKESSTSEADKVAERIARLEADNETARTDALRLRIATNHGVSAEDADLFLTGADEATLTKQAERLSQQATDRKKQGNYVPVEGNQPPPAGDDPMRDFVRSAFGKGD